MNELSKSLQELDSAADELLKKSKDDKENIKPDDVVDDKSNDKSDDDDSDDVEKAFDKPDGDNLKKSDKDCEGCEEVHKSIEEFQNEVQESFQEDEDINKGVETSEFQAALVTSIVKALGELQYDFHNKGKLDGKVNDVLAKSFRAMINTNSTLQAENEKLSKRLEKLEKSMEKGFGSIMEAIDSMSTQPAHMRKSVGSINVYDKDFNQSVNGKSVDSFDSLSKSQVMSVLNNELYAGNSMIQPSDIISYESGAPLRPELKTLVVNKCK